MDVGYLTLIAPAVPVVAVAYAQDYNCSLGLPCFFTVLGNWGELSFERTVPRAELGHGVAMRAEDSWRWGGSINPYDHGPTPFQRTVTAAPQRAPERSSSQV